MHLAYTDEANKLLEASPLALLIGMLLDQQIPMEKAFTSPDVLRERLGGTLDATTIAGYDADELEKIFRTPPALHRFPAAMAKRVQRLCQILVERFAGDAAAVWSGAQSGKEVVERVGSLPGFGPQKAQIFTALLGKQYGVQPSGWREAAGAFGAQDVHYSVADVVDGPSLEQVRAHKKQQKAAAQAAADAAAN
jgi:uncharacterized HhH-GPD family protein